ncbi:MAG: NUDIX domain-containing protein, partial [Tannerellaceae bacterium]|nr:NUDIX domain-containing protein [Tannerellaceae bacterium]
MIQDIAPHLFYNSYQPIPPTENDTLLLFKGREVMVAEEEEIRFPRVKDFTGEEGSLLLDTVYFFSIDHTRYFSASDWKQIPAGFTLTDINLFREGTPKKEAFAGVTGFSLANWYASHRFCGRCGRPMQHHAAERMLQCPECRQSEYPKILPAVIVGVTNGNKLLLTKYANRPYTNYALIAGFTEIGESIEETVRREVMEEAGVKVK